jgi:hypothetical protein
MAKALVCYVVNIYPEGVNLCKLLDSLAQHIVKGGTCIDQGLDTTSLEKLRSYVQAEEKERNGFEENWVSAETSAHAITLLS